MNRRAHAREEGGLRCTAAGPRKPSEDLHGRGHETVCRPPDALERHHGHRGPLRAGQRRLRGVERRRQAAAPEVGDRMRLRGVHGGLEVADDRVQAGRHGRLALQSLQRGPQRRDLAPLLALRGAQVGRAGPRVLQGELHGAEPVGQALLHRGVQRLVELLQSALIVAPLNFCNALARVHSLRGRGCKGRGSEAGPAREPHLHSPAPTSAGAGGLRG
mmetsp:Transcript_38523/g.118961  ORF Transcript_38523/g.118961 Transcript_38523/m.118961 type:complete len:217 (-) Transcript_38523:26-676(-)